jgi:hypothetical protein
LCVVCSVTTVGGVTLNIVELLQMWSSLTLRRSKDKTKDVTIVSDKEPDIVNKKLARAATFCYDSNHKENNTKKSWLKNLPKVKQKFTKNKNAKCQEKCESYPNKQGQGKTVNNSVQDRVVNVERIKHADKER